jgi:Tol biopolymer transport system component
LVFQSRRHRNWDLYSIRADGSGLERLTTHATADWAPAWSPDGTQIAFTMANYASYREDVAVLDLDTSVVVRFVMSDSLDLQPDWQPLSANAGS